MKKVFITGGLGFLGSHIKEAAQKKDLEVVVYDSGVLPAQKEERVTYVQGDICDLDSMQKALRGCDTFFHTAAIADIGETRTRPIETMHVNITGTANCLLASHNAGVKHFIFTSSAYAVSNLGSFYGVSKSASENLCKTFNEEYGLPFTVVRYGSLYGRRATKSNFIRQLCEAVIRGKTFKYYGTGEELREYLHVEDAARETLNIPIAEEYKNKTVFITGHQRMYIKDLFDITGEIVGKKINIDCLAKDDHRHYKSTPWSFHPDIPIRINMKHYIDINEGIHSYLQDLHEKINEESGGSK